MDPNQWKRVDQLLQAALERPPGDRTEFLRQACAGDEALEREVQSLLAAQRDAGSFLENPAMDHGCCGLCRKARPFRSPARPFPITACNTNWEAAGWGWYTRPRIYA